MWSLLFCISSTSIFSRAIAARTAFQRRSSSCVEIGVLRRSDMDITLLPGCGLAHDIDHLLRLAGEIACHVAGERRHGALLVALRIAAEMREDGEIFRLPQRTIGRQRLLREHIERGAGN